MILIIWLLLHPASAIIGYDCTAKSLNVTASLVNLGDCSLSNVEPKQENIKVQLLQGIHYKEADIIQCKIEVRRTAYECSFLGNLQPVEGGEAEYLHKTTKDLCLQLQRTGTFLYEGRHVLDGLTVNATHIRPITFAGDAASCRGAPFSDQYGSWPNVLVKGTLKITLVGGTAQVEPATNLIRLPSGTTCSLADEKCLDMEQGYTFWKRFPADRCETGKYTVLYEGPAVKITD